MPAGEGTTDNSASVGSLPSLATLRARVNAVLRNSEYNFVEEWFIDQMLNEAYIDLNARLRIKNGSATGTTDTDGILTVPTDMVEMKNLWLGSLPVLVVDDDTWLSYVNTGTLPSDQYGNTMAIARVNGETIETSYTDTDYTLEYVARPTEMVSETDTPSALWPELVPRLVFYARAHAKFQEGEAQDGATYMAMYEEGLPGRPRATYRLRPGPITLIPEPGPFEF